MAQMLYMFILCDNNLYFVLIISGFHTK